jgi:hypothetical protein
MLVRKSKDEVIANPRRKRRERAKRVRKKKHAKEGRLTSPAGGGMSKLNKYYVPASGECRSHQVSSMLCNYWKK